MTGREVADKIAVLIAEHGDMPVVRDLYTDRHDKVTDIFVWSAYDGTKFIVMAGVDEETWLNDEERS